MGMSASQARLLSITARLTSNEYESQFLTNSKMRLSSKTQEASNEYIQALNSKKYQFTYYNSSGEAQDYDLTAGYLYTYSDLKNQYQIRKASGVNLVSTTDAKNYEETNSLHDFLKCYNLVDDTDNDYDVKMAEYEEDLAEWTEKCTEIKEQYQIDLKKYNEVDYPKYLEELEKYKKDYEEYSKHPGDDAAYNAFVAVLGTSDNNPQECYEHALTNPRGGAGCYLHVLAHLIDWDGEKCTGDSYTTTIGSTVSPYSYSITGDMHKLAKEKNFEDVSAIICDEDNPRYCDGYDVYNADETQAEKNKLKEVLENAGLSGKTANEINDIISADDTNKYKEVQLWRLRSDYYVDDSGNMQLKTLKQKAIDLFDLIENHLGELTDDEIKETLINYTDGDMKSLATAPEKPEPPTKPYLELPKKPEVPEFPIVINDKDKGQWYVNLWNLMNGSDSANCVTQKQADNNVWPNETEYWAVEAPTKSKTGGNYEAIEDNLLNSSEWLSNALKLGTVTLIKPQYSTSNENLGSANERVQDRYYWDEMSLSSSVDITEVDDEEAISKAEAVYQRKVDAIEEEDDSYTQKIKRLDTEHTSLQTEYSSVQSEMNKNIERSYKTFSA